MAVGVCCRAGCGVVAGGVGVKNEVQVLKFLDSSKKDLSHCRGYQEDLKMHYRIVISVLEWVLENDIHYLSDDVGGF